MRSQLLLVLLFSCVWCVIFLLLPSRFFFIFLASSSWTMIGVQVLLYMYLFHSAFVELLAILLFFTKLDKFLTIISSNIFFHSSLSPFTFWDANYISVRIFAIILQIFESFLIHYLKNILFIRLETFYWSFFKFILFSPPWIPNLLLSLSSKFFLLLLSSALGFLVSSVL